MASRVLRVAMERKPDDADLLTRPGDIYRSGREYEFAAEACRLVLKAGPTLPDALEGLGLALQDIGETAEGRRSGRGTSDGGRPVRLAAGPQLRYVRSATIRVASLPYRTIMAGAGMSVR